MKKRKHNPHAQRFRRYRLTQKRWDAMLKRQKGKCAICLISPALVVDHDHSSHKVRGLLCKMCNFGLGCFKDDPVRIRQSVRYLRKYTIKHWRTK